MANSFSHEDVLPDVALDGVRLPRQQVGNAPQSVAVMLLADFWLAPRAWFPSAAMVALLCDFGITPTSAQAVVSRLAKRSVLEGTRRGRRTFYRLTEPAAAALLRGGHAMATYTRQAESWDGQWTLIAFSTPPGAESEQRVLRGRLRWRGYAPLYDGLWVSPQAPTELLRTALAKATRSEITLFRAGHLDPERTATRDPLRVWDLDAVGDYYQAFIHRWSPLPPRIRAGEVTGPEALQVRVEIEDDYRRFVVLDPRLPVRLLPDDWPRQRARELFATVYDHLTDPALQHVRATLTQAGDDGPAEIRGHTTEDLAAGVLLAHGQAGQTSQAL